MSISIVFILGLCIAFIGVIPPGMLNMTAAKISLKEGHTRGFVFSIGVCCDRGRSNLFSSSICAKYLSQHPDVIDILKRVALVLFILISIYFFLVAKSEDNIHEMGASKSKKSRFFQGILMSALNVFPIPYQAYMVTTLVSYQWLSLDNISIVYLCSRCYDGNLYQPFIFIFCFLTKLKILKYHLKNG